MEKLASQHRIINNIFDYGDEVLYYVTFKEGGKSRINNNIFSLTITQVNTKKKLISTIRYTDMYATEIKGNSSNRKINEKIIKKTIRSNGQE